MNNVIPDGPYERYHDNGQLEFKGTFKDGEISEITDGYSEEPF